MFIIQFIIKIVFFIINNIFLLFGYNTIENEKKYRKYINYFLNINSNNNENNNIEINSDRNTN